MVARCGCDLVMLDAQGFLFYVFYDCFMFYVLYFYVLMFYYLLLLFLWPVRRETPFLALT